VLIISHLLASSYMLQLFVMSRFIRYKYTGGPIIKKFGTWNLTMHLLGYFVIREMGLVKVYPYTKFEVSSFTRSKGTAPVQCNYGWMREGMCPN